MDVLGKSTDFIFPDVASLHNFYSYPDENKPVWGQTFMPLTSGRVYLNKAPIEDIRFSPLAIKAFLFW